MYGNRGSEFHSCLAMLALPEIDGMLLFGGSEALVFRSGAILAPLGQRRASD